MKKIIEKTKILNVLLILCLQLNIACVSTEAQTYKKGYYFETYDLSTPIKLIHLLQKSFEKNDYSTIWFCLDYRARIDFMTALHVSEYRKAFNGKIKQDKILDFLRKNTTVFEAGDKERLLLTKTSLYQVFIQFQMAAINHGLEIYKMAPNVDILNIQKINNTYAVASLSDGYIAKLTRNTKGQWRLYQIYQSGKPKYSYPIRDAKALYGAPMYEPVDKKE